MKYPTYEIEDGIKQKGFKYIVGVDEAGRGCEHPSAEVLTDNGWKYYTNLEMSDMVLSYTNNGNIVWQNIDSVVEKDFYGNLIEFKNRSVHMLVTPDHCFDTIRRTFKRDKLNNNRLKLTGYTFNCRKHVSELLGNDFIPRGGKWVGKDKKYFVLPAVARNKYDNSKNDYSKKTILMRDWVAFLGIYLSEGSVNYKNGGGYRIEISQSRLKSNDTYSNINGLLKKLPFNFKQHKHGFTLYNKQLYSYLKEFGKCYDKFIPKEIKGLCVELLNILVEWMVLGDGSCYKGKNRKRVCIYYTVSKKLKDDFEEVLLKSGRTFNTNVREAKDSYIRGRLIKKENKVGCYEIRIRHNNKIHVRSLLDNKRSVFYSGKVFCLSLPKYHNFYIRRSGTGYFTGNSLSGPVIGAAVRIPDFITPSLFGKVKDSKKLSEKRREELYEMITYNCDWAIGQVDNNVIDEINILEATKVAMKLAVKNIAAVDYIIVDGNFTIPGINTPQQAVIDGDNISISIATASIIAKVTRDRLMYKLHEKFPVYGWNRNKGYGTKEHRDALKTYGPCKYHRRSFSSV